MSYDDEREARLPKWAQRELGTLRHQLAQAVAALESKAVPGTNTLVRRRGLPDLELARNQEVTFLVGGSTIGIRVETYPGAEADAEYLNVQDNGHSSLAVFPWVTNVLHVVPVKR